MAGIFPEEDEDAIYLSRTDPDEMLGTFFNAPFTLDELVWPTVEHYFQAMKFDDQDYLIRVNQAPSPDKARKMGRSRFKKIRQDWAKVKQTVMTRGVYIKCRSHPLVAEALLSTDENKLVENSQYDYFWGCGRDRRGKNTYGQVLMNVRNKLREEQ